jgi:uncharacterized HAD superfamily protein
MNIGIDIDGVIANNPAVYKNLMEEWVLSGFNIYIITGSKRGDMPKKRRLEQLEFLGITPRHYTELIIANGSSDRMIGDKKGLIAKKKKLNLFIDDDIRNCMCVRQKVPKCVVLREQSYLKT